MKPPPPASTYKRTAGVPSRGSGRGILGVSTVAGRTTGAGRSAAARGGRTGQRPPALRPGRGKDGKKDPASVREETYICSELSRRFYMKGKGQVEG